MIRPLLCAAAVFLLAGCAGSRRSARPAGPSEKPIGTYGRLGVALCPAEDGVRVFDEVKGMPGPKAGLRAADVVTAFNGVELAPAAHRKDFLFTVRSGKPVSLAIKRDGRSLTVDAVPRQVDLYESDAIRFALFDAVLTGEQVAVAVVVSEVNHTAPQVLKNAEGVAAWKAGVKAAAQAAAEGLLLYPGLLHCGNYSVVDRSKTEQVLSELHFQMTGAVDAGLMKNVGKMTGATHISFLSITRFSDARRQAWIDQVAARLVEIESGKVLATANWTVDAH